MSTPEPAPRVRRPPPAWRPVTVRHVRLRSPRMLRVTLEGPALAGLTVEEPAASVRLLLPSADVDDLVIPAWNGNEFLLPDGSRPTLRTFTPQAVPDGPGIEPCLGVDVVVHDRGAASRWASEARPGAPAAISGPGRGYTVDPQAPAYLLAGDETAIPAIGQLLTALPADTAVEVHVEVAHPDARGPLAPGAAAAVHWHDLVAGAPPGDALVRAVAGAAIAPGTRIWVAGEAAGVQRLRRHLFEQRGVPREDTTIRGYWKDGRGGEA